MNKQKHNGKAKKTSELKTIPTESSSEWLTSDDGIKLFVRHWKTKDKETRAILQIVHGMGEHSLRYERIAQRLSKEGIEVWASDLRGHGKTADLSVNHMSLGGLLGHCADESAIEKITSDIHFVNKMINKLYPEKPLFILGHSWGSFLTQNYIETYNDFPLAGCILSGTCGPSKGLKLKVGVHFMKILSALKGIRKHSRLARAIVDSPFNKPFKPNRTEFDWLSRDQEEVNAYVNDPLCGILLSTGFYYDLSFLLTIIHKNSNMQKIRRDLPIYVFCGSCDPVGNMGESPTALVNEYCSLGISDLEFVLYPSARHETLNETNKEEVSENLLNWINKHIVEKEVKDI